MCSSLWETSTRVKSAERCHAGSAKARFASSEIQQIIYSRLAISELEGALGEGRGSSGRLEATTPANRPGAHRV